MTGPRLILAIVGAAAVLLLLEIVRYFIARSLVDRSDPDSAPNIQFMSPFLVNFVFIVMLPCVVYAALYPVLPFTSFRSGFFIALFVFGVGVLPTHIRNQHQHRLPTLITAFDLFWNLLTLLAVIGSITYLYHY
jgi:hypothetical protein